MGGREGGNPLCPAEGVSKSECHKSWCLLETRARAKEAICAVPGAGGKHIWIYYPLGGILELRLDLIWCDVSDWEERFGLSLIFLA